MVGTLGCSAGTAPSDDSSPRVGAEVPAAALTRLARAWDAGDEAAAADLASPGDADARELLAIPARNVRALGLRDVRLERSTPGSARVSWRMPAVDSSPSRVNVRVRVTGRGLAIEPTTTSPMPLWLTEPQLTEREVGSVRVLGAPQHDLARILGDARRARSVVRRAWPTWDGRLVVEVASSQQRMAAAPRSVPGGVQRNRRGDFFQRWHNRQHDTGPRVRQPVGVRRYVGAGRPRRDGARGGARRNPSTGDARAVVVGGGCGGALGVRCSCIAGGAQSERRGQG